jgi:D-glycero-beta-D-manno-heptose 1-phosphate adenylyltransferase
MSPNNIQSKLTSKIFSIDDFVQLSSSLKKQGRKIVFTNGCFDILHLGHLDYLSKARDLGDFLVVGLNSDLSIKKLKGNGRPIQNEVSRTYHLASLFFVDAIVVFDEDTPCNIINQIIPHVLVKGGDYSLENIVGAEVVEKHGGVVQTIDFLEGFSTTNIINKILETENNKF